MADQTKSASLQITVNPSLQIPFQMLVNGSVGTPYRQMITLTGGTAPLQRSVYDGPIITGSPHPAAARLTSSSSRSLPSDWTVLRSVVWLFFVLYSAVLAQILK